MKAIISILIIVTICFVIGCSKQGTDKPGGGSQEIPAPTSCDGVNAKFTVDVLPIFQTKCANGAGCHGNGSTNGPGSLNNFPDIKDAATNIKAAVNSGRMPLTGSLSSTELKQINCWIDNGRLNN